MDKRKGIFATCKKWGPTTKLVLILTIAGLFFALYSAFFGASNKGQEEIKKQIKERFDSLEKLASSQNWKSHDNYYKEAKIFYDAGMLYTNQGRNKDAAEAFLLFRDIAEKVKDYNAAAGSSIIAAWRYDDIKDYKKSAELKAEAGNFYLKLNEIREAILWKKEAAGLFIKVGLKNRAEELYKEIAGLRS